MSEKMIDISNETRNLINELSVSQQITERACDILGTIATQMEELSEEEKDKLSAALIETLNNRNKERHSDETEESNPS